MLFEMDLRHLDAADAVRTDGDGMAAFLLPPHSQEMRVQNGGIAFDAAEGRNDRSPSIAFLRLSAAQMRANRPRFWGIWRRAATIGTGCAELSESVAALTGMRKLTSVAVGSDRIEIFPVAG